MQDEAYIRWVEIDKEKEWGVMALLKSIGIHPWNVNLLISEGVTAKEIVSWYLYVFTIPAGKITASRESVMVASLKESPHSPYPGPFERLASLPPEELQDLFRRAIRSYGGRVGDLDWDHALAQVKVMDLALLAERLGLARIIREAGT